MKTKTWKLLASLAAIAALGLAWVNLVHQGSEALNSEPAPSSEAGRRQMEPHVEALQSEIADAEPAPSRTEVPETETSEAVQPRPKVLARDCLQVIFRLDGKKPVKLPEHFLPVAVDVYVEGVEEPISIPEMAGQFSRGSDRYYLRGYPRDDGWKIERFTVDDPRFEPADVIVSPPDAKARGDLIGSSGILVEAIDAETRAPVTGWSAIAMSSSCGLGGDAQLGRHPEYPGGWAQVAAANYWVEVKHPDYVLGGAAVVAPPGGVGRATIELHRESRLRGRVIFDDFTPVQGARIRLAVPESAGVELPVLNRKPLFDDSNSIAPFYRWVDVTESGEDGAFELAFAAEVPVIIEATAGQQTPQRLRVEPMLGQELFEVEVVLPRGRRLEGQVRGFELESGRGLMIRACGPNGAGEMLALQWDHEYGDGFVAAWADARGHFSVGPFPQTGGIQVNVIDAPLTVEPYDYLNKTDARILHTEVVTAKNGVLEPVLIDLE